jgi:hypothetical protein
MEGKLEDTVKWSFSTAQAKAIRPTFVPYLKLEAP